MMLYSGFEQVEGILTVVILTAGILNFGFLTTDISSQEFSSQEFSPRTSYHGHFTTGLLIYRNFYHRTFRRTFGWNFRRRTFRRTFRWNFRRRTFHRRTFYRTFRWNFHRRIFHRTHGCNLTALHSTSFRGILLIFFKIVLSENYIIVPLYHRKANFTMEFFTK